ncbi:MULTISPECIES: MBL fold metallo-hydrolase [unclassified Bacillus (in: firmicutes)]|uniref:MBL fold metallo-hydrolase n=1 Tax=unclassified Bacillus (in: firmicutes) TaxID=185979 RepID=UPI0008E74282|nr:MULTISPECIES: MBL fold metallo-hydrolase [unclassified Bacillus (in: firmicutes)]SFA79789.1 Ribonuclease BN, tRNA processing enzyme [Bacillus sp. UNCCL13]SFQ69849.1 Ribonuclease BN, tRNA processing enzyme [Bacillus sp. cl95]
MKLTIIGFWGGYPKANGASSGYLLEHDGFQLLIDCGSGVLAKLQNKVQPEEIDAMIVSHYHPDHIADIGVIQHARLIQGFLGKKMTTLPIYAHAENQTEFAKLTYKDITKGMAYQPNEPLTVGPFTITFVKTIHPAPCYAMRIEAGGKAIVYTADSAYQDAFVPFSEKADLLLCECNFYAGQNASNAGHMTSTDAGMLAQKAGVKQLILTHLPQFGNLENLVTEAAAEYKGFISLAEEFMEITL